MNKLISWGPRKWVVINITLATTRSQDENDKENPDCRVKVSVSEELLSGIDEAATVYVFHRKDANDSQCNIDYYPFTWTPAN